MYRVTVRRSFIAQHFLTVPNCGPENEWHSHQFTLEVEIQGPSLNEHGYLVDIDNVKRAIDDILGRYEDTTLNELPEFEDLNPSIEHFSRFCWKRVSESVNAPNVTHLTTRLWEDEDAWASYEGDLSE